MFLGTAARTVRAAAKPCRTRERADGCSEHRAVAPACREFRLGQRLRDTRCARRGRDRGRRRIGVQRSLGPHREGDGTRRRREGDRGRRPHAVRYRRVDVHRERGRPADAGGLSRALRHLAPDVVQRRGRRHGLGRDLPRAGRRGPARAQGASHHQRVLGGLGLAPRRGHRHAGGLPRQRADEGAVRSALRLVSAAGIHGDAGLPSHARLRHHGAAARASLR